MTAESGLPRSFANAVMQYRRCSLGDHAAQSQGFAMADKGCLSLFGDRPEQHRLLAEHLTAEYRVRTEGRGRTVDEWKQRPERSDNH